MTAQPLMRAAGLGRVFGRGRRAVTALADVSFEIERGDVFGIVGGSGSGKSTLARLLVALDAPTAGSASFEGVDLASLRGGALRRLRPRLQLVFQDPLTSADPRWTARATIEEALGIRPAAASLGDLLELVHLAPDVIARRPHALSGGERQRVALARALAVSPEVLILDEAVSALDSVTRRAVIDSLLRWRADRNATLVFISHDLRLVSAIANRTLVLDRGRVLALGAPGEVLS